MFCTNCGSELDVWVRFCPKCGLEVPKETDQTLKTSVDISAVNMENNQTATMAENLPLTKTNENTPVVNINVKSDIHSFSPIIFFGAFLSFIAYFVPFFQSDIFGHTEEVTYISLINDINKSISTIKNYSSNYIISNFTPSVSRYLLSVAADAMKIQIILCVPIVFSFIAFICSFRKHRMAKLFAILSGISLTAIVFYISSKYGDVFKIISDFTSLRIGVLLYLIGILMVIMGPSSPNKYKTF